MSSENICLFFKLSGMSPPIMRCASPSAMAVLPTPGSPIKIGLFFVRRDRICNTRRISSSRPMTGSNLPARARSFRFLAYLFSAWYVSSALASLALCPLRSSLTASVAVLASKPWVLSRRPEGVSVLSMAIRSSSSVMYSSPNCLSNSCALLKTFSASAFR